VKGVLQQVFAATMLYAERTALTAVAAYKDAAAVASVWPWKGGYHVVCVIAVMHPHWHLLHLNTVPPEFAPEGSCCVALRWHDVYTTHIGAAAAPL
jgi:hypothetical protein